MLLKIIKNQIKLTIDFINITLCFAELNAKIGIFFSIYIYIYIY